MEDRAPLLRLAAIGLIGVALVLIALWFSRRLFTPSQPVDPAPPAATAVEPAAAPPQATSEQPVRPAQPAHPALAELEAQRAALQQQLFDIRRELMQEQLARGEYEELVIRRGDPVPSGDGLHAHNQIGPHPTDPDKQVVKQVSLSSELSPEHAAITKELEEVDKRIAELRR